MVSALCSKSGVIAGNVARADGSRRRRVRIRYAVSSTAPQAVRQLTNDQSVESSARLCYVSSLIALGSS
jgi:hypothetical protein